MKLPPRNKGISQRFLKLIAYDSLAGIRRPDAHTKAKKRAAGGRTFNRDDGGRFASGGPVESMADGGSPTWDNTVEDLPTWDNTKPVEPDRGGLSAAWQGAKAGATFNFNDELAGISAAKPSWAPGNVMGIPTGVIAGAGRLGLNAITGKDPEAVASYEKARDEEREAGEVAKQQHPYLHMAGELAGSIPAMAVLPEAGFAARAAQTASKAAKFGRTVADSAVIGGGADIGDRALKSAQGIVSGVVGGAVAPVVGEGAGLVYNRFVKPGVNAVRGWADPEGEAARRLSAAIQADQHLIASGQAKGMSPQEWAAARQAGEPVTLADLGSTNTQALLRSAANTSPEARAILEKTIEDRFAGQTERVGDEVRNLVAGGANAHKTGDELVAEYDRAR